jgi:hypothetical protein
MRNDKSWIQGTRVLIGIVAAALTGAGCSSEVAQSHTVQLASPPAMCQAQASQPSIKPAAVDECGGEDVLSTSCGPAITIYCAGGATFTVPQSQAACVPICSVDHVDCGGYNAYAVVESCPWGKPHTIDPLPSGFVPTSGCSYQYMCV